MSTKDFIEKDYYEALGVPKDATPAEIKKAYRKLARELPPGRQQGDAAAEERFKEISEAYDVLVRHQAAQGVRRGARAVRRRRRFRAAPGGRRRRGGSFNVRPRRPVRQPAGGPAGLGDIFGGLFGGGGPGGRSQRRGAAPTSSPR